MSLPTLSLLETRVLGVLVEKQHTVPDTYPLTLNALVAGCNQKTSRDPILNATEAEVQAVVDHLKTLSLAVESSGGRVMRYAHNVGKVLAIPSQSVALLAAIMLRGPQTVGELRINCERLHHFADISAVERLHHFADISAVEGFLQRQRGRPARWSSSCRASPAPVKRAGRTCFPARLPPIRSSGCPLRKATSSRCPKLRRCGRTSPICKANLRQFGRPWRSCAQNWASRRPETADAGVFVALRVMSGWVEWRSRCIPRPPFLEPYTDRTHGFRQSR